MDEVSKEELVEFGSSRWRKRLSLEKGDWRKYFNGNAQKFPRVVAEVSLGAIASIGGVKGLG